MRNTNSRLDWVGRRRELFTLAISWAHFLGSMVHWACNCFMVLMGHAHGRSDSKKVDSTEMMSDLNPEPQLSGGLQSDKRWSEGQNMKCGLRNELFVCSIMVVFWRLTTWKLQLMSYNQINCYPGTCRKLFFFHLQATWDVEFSSNGQELNRLRTLIGVPSRDRTQSPGTHNESTFFRD